MYVMLFFVQSRPLKTVKAHEPPEHTDYAIHNFHSLSTAAKHINVNLNISHFWNISNIWNELLHKNVVHCDTPYAVSS